MRDAPPRTNAGVNRPGRAGSVFVVLCLVAAAGCGSVQVSVVSDVPLRAEWVVVVFPLDEAAAGRAVADFSLCGYTGAQGSGVLVAREVTAAFDSHTGLRDVGREALHRIIREEGLSLQDLAVLDEARACDLARRMKADMLVLGRVLCYRTSWFLFYSRTKVDLELRGLAPATGQALWRARMRRSAPFTSARRTTCAYAARLAAAIGDALCRPAAAGTHSRPAN